MRTSVILGALLGLLALAIVAFPGRADLPEYCLITGHSIAVPNPDDPSLGEWKYCVTIDWSTLTQRSPLYFDLILGLAECECVCELFSFAAADTAGASDGVDANGQPCAAYYGAAFLCDGDPVMEIYEPLVQFTPLENGCDPAPTGIGTFCFYSDWPPAPVSVPNVFLGLHSDLEDCYGELSGVLPLCTCTPTPVENRTWGGLKHLFGE